MAGGGGGGAVCGGGRGVAGWRFLQIELLGYLESCPTFSWERECGRLVSHFKPCDGSFKRFALILACPLEFVL